MTLGVRPRSVRLAALGLGLSLGGVAYADGESDAARPDAAEDNDPPKPDPEPLPVLLAVVPGVLLHGMGSFAAGRSQAGWSLFWMQQAAHSFIASAGVTLAATGANRYLSGPSAVLAINGAGLLMISWLTDVYAVATKEGGTGRAATRAPRIESHVGYRTIVDPQFRGDHMLVTGFDLRFGRISLAPTGYFVADGNSSRLAGSSSFRFLGPLPEGPTAKDGSYVDLRVGGTWHRVADERFTRSGPEVEVSVRVDMERFDRSFAGSFGELSTGIAVQSTEFDVVGSPSSSETALLGRFAWGFYVGTPDDIHGEVSTFYDHRHDEYEGGLTGFGIGLPGHFGLDGELFLTEGVGIRTEAAMGAAFVAGGSLVFRAPASP